MDHEVGGIKVGTCRAKLKVTAEQEQAAASS